MKNTPVILLAAIALLVVCSLSPAAIAQGIDAPAIYRRRCAMCHDHATGRIPSREAISGLAAQDVIFDLTFGVMQPQGLGLSAQEIAALAEYVTGKSATPGPQPDPNSNHCPETGPDGTAGAPLHFDDSQWNGWGHDAANPRYQDQPGFTAADLPNLKVKWVFAYPGPFVGSQPTIVGGRVFASSTTGLVYSLNASTGCTYWTFQADSEVRAAISVGPLSKSSPVQAAIYFADLMKASAYALDARTGKLLWKTKLDPHPLARITGAPTLYGDRLYVPVSAQEEGYGADETYPCCTFRGSVVALDARTGKVIWNTYTIPTAPAPTKKTLAGVQMYGPAGAAVWSAPTIDPKRKLIYIGTGDSYTDVPTKTSDAVIALDMKTGAIRWVNQATANDNYLYGCSVAGKGICPQPVGPDYDFGSSPILAALPDGKQVILAGQKSGLFYAFDPDDRGELLWKVQVGPGSMGGGVVWGSAADSENVYVPIANRADSSLSALKIADGSKVWQKPAPAGVCSWGAKGCSGTEAAAVTAIPGVVFSGSTDGHLRAYSTKDGSVVWDFDTGQTYQAVNGVPAHGGSINNSGPTIANGMLYINSGEGRFVGHRGNALIAFSVDGK
jgi:polyvinyl alcohol dehydrogenase (cytochrome)